MIFQHFKYGVKKLNDTISINEENLNKLILDIYDYNEKINNILNQIIDLIAGSKDYFKCSVETELLNKLSYLEDNKNNLIYNITNYANDLMKVKMNFKEISASLTIEVNKHTKIVENSNYIEEVK